MGFRFGSPTGEFSSGTEEEFSLAVSEFLKRPILKIQFYFSRAQVDVSRLDLGHLEKVRKFKSQVASKGLLYREFQDIPELKILVRKAILADALNILDQQSELSSGNEVSETHYRDLKPYQKLKNYSSLFASDPEVSSMVLLKEAGREIEQVTRQMNIGSDLLNRLTSTVVRVTKEFSAIQSGKKNSKPAIKLYEKLLQDLEGFVDWFEHSISDIEKHLALSLNRFQRGAEVYGTYSENYNLEIGLALKPLSEFKHALSNQIGVGRTFESYPDLPGLGQKWNGNIKVLRALGRDYDEFLERAVELIDEVELAVRS